MLVVGEVLWDRFPDSQRLGGAPLNFAVAELAGRCLARLVLKGDRVIAEERLLTEMTSAP